MSTAAAADVRRDLIERGYHVLGPVFSDRELQRIRDLLDDGVRARGADACGGEFGCVFHPALAELPELAPVFARAEVVDAVRAALGDEPRLAHSGALVGDGARGFTPWHYHRSDALTPSAWDPSRRWRPRRIERVLANCYVDGSDDELGPLLLLPRRVDDPLAPPSQERSRDWPHQVAVRCLPGSVVVFDQSVWHAARPSRVGRRRRLVGGHYQGWSDPTPHREDNASDVPALAPWLEREPLLRRLLRRP